MNVGWDCHAHLFGPYERFPLAPDRDYTPPEALEGQYIELLAKLGLSHGVLIHPSAYDGDFSLLFEALASRPNLRGVIVANAGNPMTFSGLRDKGVRAARFSHRSGAGANFAGSASFEDLLSMAARLADAGMHAELWTDCKALPDIADQLRALPVPVVIDHMGGFDITAGIDDPGFRCLLSLIADGKAWLKLCVYRNLLTGHDFEEGAQFHRALLAANPEVLLWGSDWPHLRVVPPPDTAKLLAKFKRWTGSERLVRKILVTNPSVLYG
ncbi:amidohydrolase family protein [Bradyrhizobium sp. WSM3983]|uniref:amidohydrolase family protein n=1 Tax=Bradyrhizobium sp. WSM3983 TaxID=1038867 RepID=UPI000A02EC90|nr:amidohydrolase family protein [Bradyrhizobium sp. WSM3983]